MSSWDAPTGNWDSRQQPDDAGRPGEQGYQPGEPGGGQHAARGEGRMRAGRRALPGYEQAQNQDQPGGAYDREAGYGPGYGQQPAYDPVSGYGPSASQPGSGFGPGAQGGGYGGAPAFGGSPQGSFASGPQRAVGPARGDVNRDDVDPLTAPGPFSAPPAGPPSGLRRAAGSLPPGPSAAHASPGSGPQGSGGYGEGGTAAYRQYGADEPTRSGWSDYADQPGYGEQGSFGTRPAAAGQGEAAAYGAPSPDYGQPTFTPHPQENHDQGYGAQAGYGQNGFGQDQNGYGQPGYGDQPGYGQNGYAQQDYGDQRGYPQDPGLGSTPPSGFGAPGARGSRGAHASPPSQARAGQDYQAEAYPQPGAEPSDYPQNAFGAGFGQNGYAGQGYQQNGYGQDAYDQNGYGAPGTGQDAYGQQAYGQDAYGTGGYGQDAYGQQPFEAPGYDEDGPDSPGSGPRSRPGAGRGGPRPAPRLGGTKMVLYLTAAVVGVVAIVFLVVHLAGSGKGTPSAGSSSPGTGTTAGGGQNAAGTYSLVQAAGVGSFPLNKAATKVVESAAGKSTSTVASALKAKKAGQPGKSVTAIYDMGSSSSFTSSAYKGLIFVGYDGTFDPAAVVKVVRTHLKSARLVDAGPHGGEMTCGYNISTGAYASECVWVTKTTFGVVEFIKNGEPAKQSGAGNLALKVRNAVEVRS